MTIPQHQRCEWKGCRARYGFYVQIEGVTLSESIYTCQLHTDVAIQWLERIARRLGVPTLRVTTTDLSRW